jgi:Coenzyme PQQ synthesis protein D (PqqD)
MLHYVTNPQVIHETIDGETIIIDLATGTYFSLQGAAPAIWNALVAGDSDQQLVARLQSVFAADAAELQDAISPFLEELVRAQLIAPGEAAGPVAAVPGPAESAERVAFIAPKLERYEDMQDIILLDPVHKVDNQGWPHAAPAVSGPA